MMGNAEKKEKARELPGTKEEIDASGALRILENGERKPL